MWVQFPFLGLALLLGGAPRDRSTSLYNDCNYDISKWKQIQ